MQNLIQNFQKNQTAGEMLRFWRKLNRVSQLDLALDVGVSSKHVSFVETGRSQPSRNLILKISQALKLPLRHQNAFLKAAGYAAEFGEEPFDGQKMGLVREALQRMLDKHEPYPALVINAAYDILMTNSGFNRTIEILIGEKALQKYGNVYRLTFAADGLHQYIEDWSVVEHFMMKRLWEDVVSNQNQELLALFKEISALRVRRDPITYQIDHDLPMLSLTFAKDSLKASFFTTITSLGTPLDLTTQELRIESMFPSDEATKQLFAGAVRFRNS